MPRMDIIAAWRDGYAHGAKDAAEACTCRQMAEDDPEERKVITIREYRIRKFRSADDLMDT